MRSEKIPPDLIKSINEKQLRTMYQTVYSNFPQGSPEYRKYEMQIKLLKSRNNKEYENSKKNIRVSRFS